MNLSTQSRNKQPPRPVAQTGGSATGILYLMPTSHRGSRQRFIYSAEGSTHIPALSPDDYARATANAPRFLSRTGWRLVFQRLTVEIISRRLMDRGAVLSFFSLLTAIPTLLAFYSITTMFLDRNRSQVTDITDQFIQRNFPSNAAIEARQVVDSIIGSTQQSIVTLIVSVLIALFSSSAYVRAFSRSANDLYGRREGRSVVRTWLTMWGLTLLLVVGLVFIAAGFFLRDDLLAPVLNRIAEPLHMEGFQRFVLEEFLPVWKYLRWPVIYGLSIVLIAALYHVAPNVRYRHMRWLTFGSVFALSGMTVVSVGVRLYLNHFLYVGMYGALGGIIAGFLGLLLVNSVLLLGLKVDAEVTRARELSVGLDSEEIIAIPPRSGVAAGWSANLSARMRQRSRMFRDNQAGLSTMDEEATALEGAKDGEPHKQSPFTAHSRFSP